MRLPCGKWPGYLTRWVLYGILSTLGTEYTESAASSAGDYQRGISRTAPQGCFPIPVASHSESLDTMTTWPFRTLQALRWRWVRAPSYRCPDNDFDNA